MEKVNPLKKITGFLHDEKGKISILDEKHVMGVWALFQFHITFISDEKEESSNQIWMNLITNEKSEFMKQQQNRIVYQSAPLYHYPIPTDLNMDEAFVIAYNKVKSDAEMEQKQRRQDQHLQKDIDRIETYYKDLLKENDRRTARKGLSEDKVKEIATKSEAIVMEMDKQLEEIKKKSYGHTEITLDHGIIYFVPILHYDIDISFRSERKRQTLYYNPITKQFDKGAENPAVIDGV
ncbi:hypothetical protein [Sporolactobacillus pectinivorans]|uniref:hypothetical protein n=1 Tax=Sporolactobacillus pectinivorans TaxID=1591408 RepID=UPI000C25FB55|nr:hypothetical protein [Sporolactobacillus pectinivorans]